MVCPVMSVAVSTIRRQSVRSLAFLQVEWIPTLTDCTYSTSVSVPLSQVVRGVHKLSSNDSDRTDAPMTRCCLQFAFAHGASHMCGAVSLEYRGKLEDSR